MKINSSFFVSFLIVVMTMGQLFADTSADEEAIKAAIKNEYQGWNDRNLSAETALWDKSANVIKLTFPDNRQFNGWEAIQSFYQSSFNEYPQTLTATTEFSNFKMRISGKSAWVVFDQKVKNANQAPMEFSQINFLEKLGGQWKFTLQAMIFLPQHNAEMAPPKHNASLIVIFKQGGPFMKLLLLIFLGIVFYSTKKAIDLFAKHDLEPSKLERGINGIIIWGGISVVVGFLSHFWGLYLAMIAIKYANDISPSIVAGGYAVSLITILFGIFIFLFTAIIWLIFRWRYNRLISA